jgi:hypothetical protein
MIMLAFSGLYIVALGWLPPVPYGPDDPAFFSTMPGGSQPLQREIKWLTEMQPQFTGARLLASTLWVATLFLGIHVAFGGTSIKLRQGWASIPAKAGINIAALSACFTLYSGGNPFTAFEYAFYIEAPSLLRDVIYSFPPTAPILIGLICGYLFRLNNREDKVAPLLEGAAKEASDIARDISEIILPGLDPETRKSVSTYVFSLESTAPLLKGDRLREREILHTSTQIRNILNRVSAWEYSAPGASIDSHIQDLLDRARSDLDALRAHAEVSDQNDLTINIAALKSQIETRS